MLFESMMHIYTNTMARCTDEIFCQEFICVSHNDKTQLTYDPDRVKEAERAEGCARPVYKQVMIDERLNRDATVRTFACFGPVVWPGSPRCRHSHQKNELVTSDH